MATTETVHKLLIGGEWYETGETIDVTSPYDGSVVGRVAYGGAEDARRAIDAAEQAMRTPIPAHQRAAVLDGVAELLRERRDEFARTIAEEAGKPLTTAGMEVDRAVQTMTFSALEARRLTGETVPMDAHPAGEGHAGLILRMPIGIVAAISPFNFPLNLVAHKVGPGFAAGCAVVLKPAGATPLSALLLAQAFEDAGQPAGWLNVIVGKSRDIGDVLTEDERVRMITFTGSSEVGWGIRARANKKKVSLELGNSTPLIVLADADLEKAAAAIAAHGYSFAGQSCISIQRVYVEDSVHDELIEKLTPKVAALKVGDPLDADTQVGPVIDHENRDRIKEWVDDGGRRRRQAGHRRRDRRRRRASPGAAGRCLAGDEGLVQRGVRPGRQRSRASPGSTQAIELANGTNYGLQAGIYTQDITKALRAARTLDFGGVTLNEAPTYRADQMPYGGVKDSGNTREGPKFAVQEMTEPRMVVINL